MSEGETTSTLPSKAANGHRRRSTHGHRNALVLGLTFVVLACYSPHAIRSCCNVGDTTWPCSYGRLDASVVQLFAKPTQEQAGVAWFPCPDVTEFECAYLTVPLDVRSWSSRLHALDLIPANSTSTRSQMRPSRLRSDGYQRVRH